MKLGQIAPATRRATAVWTIAGLALALAVTTAATGSSAPAVAFRQIGHWFYSPGQGAAFHVDGGSKDIDARVAGLDATPGSPVVQDATHGYVADRDQVVVFGKSTLRVEGTTRTGIDETPLGIETVGGPYLVYPEHGQIVRLGTSLTTITAGGVLSRPAVTTDGTLWFTRGGSDMCRLGAKDTALDCSAHLVAGHRNAVTTVHDRPAVVDTTAGTVRVMQGGSLGPARSLGVRIAPTAQVGPTDVQGKIAILSGSTLTLVDTQARPAKPVRVAVGTDDTATLSTTGTTVAVLDPVTRHLKTFDPAGHRRADEPLGAATTAPSLTRGEDGRVYVDGTDGTKVYVVDANGSVTPVPVDGDAPSSPSAGAVPDPVTPPRSTPPTPRPPRVTPPSPTSTAPLPAPADPAPADPAPNNPAPTGSAPPGSDSGQGNGSGSGGSDRSGGDRTSSPPASPPARPQPQPTRPTPAATAPGAPGAVSAVAGNATIAVRWSAAAANGSAIRSYDVSWQASGQPAGHTTTSASTTATTLRNLRNGAAYVVTVAAINGIGRGPAVSAAAATPRSGQPGAPTAVRATAAPDGSVAVSWTAANGRGHTISSYTVRAGTGRTLGTTTATRLGVASGTLTPGTSYTFTVTATDDAGATSAASAASAAVTPFVPAAAPTGVQARAGDASVALSWSPGGLGGGRLVHYVVQGAGRTVTTTATNATVTGLTNGTAYAFTVQAVTGEQGNSGGPQATGAESATVRATPQAPVQVGTITVSLGAKTSETNCTPADCYWMHVVLTGFAPNRTYHLQPHSSHPDYLNGGADLTTDGQGRLSVDRFAYGDGGTQVWVTAGGVESNHFTWPQSAPQAQPKIHIARGPATSANNCDKPKCHLVHIELSGFDANTAMEIELHSTVWGNDDAPDETVTTDGNGNVSTDLFPLDRPGIEVWVTADHDGVADAIQSNHLPWQ